MNIICFNWPLRKERIIIKPKQTLALILIGALTLTLLGCSTDKPGNIIFPENEYRDYIKKARAGETDLERLFADTVTNPVKDKYDVSGWPSSALKDTDTLERSINAIVEEGVVGIIDQALKKSYLLLEELEDVKVFIMPLDPRTKYGASGGMTQLGEIFININPSYRYWKELVPYVVAHEYHHRYLYYIHNENQLMGGTGTLLDILVTEGKADSFAQIIDPDAFVPWHKFMVSQEQLNRFKDNLNTTDHNIIAELMFNVQSSLDTADARGYSVGYQIVQAFINNNPDVSILEWTAMSSEEILEKSDFEWQVNN